MATAVQEKTEQKAPAATSVLLRGIRWSTYQAILDDIGDRRLPHSYDRGDLEIMLPGYEHDFFSLRFPPLLDILSDELGIRFECAGSTTLGREDLEKGLEPDQSFYIRHEAQIRGKKELDLSEVPPPDLAIEIDITRKSINRLEIYAALGVPEVWRFSDNKLIVYHLGPDGTYALAKTSLSFPWLPLTELGRFLELAPTMDRLSWRQSFRAWVREHVVPIARGPAGDA
jgi:Uma2 family endonuclease